MLVELAEFNTWWGDILFFIISCVLVHACTMLPKYKIETKMDIVRKKQIKIFEKYIARNFTTFTAPCIKGDYRYAILGLHENVSERSIKKRTRIMGLTESELNGLNVDSNSKVKKSIESWLNNDKRIRHWYYNKGDYTVYLKTTDSGEDYVQNVVYRTNKWLNNFGEADVTV